MLTVKVRTHANAGGNLVHTLETRVVHSRHGSSSQEGKKMSQLLRTDERILKHLGADLKIYEEFVKIFKEHRQSAGLATAGLAST